MKWTSDKLSIIKTELEKGKSYKEIATLFGDTVDAVKGASKRNGLTSKKESKTIIERSCTNCGKTTTNNKFCSRSCSTSFNNLNRVDYTTRRKGVCKACGTAIISKHWYCEKCRPQKATQDDKTLGEVIYEKHHRSSAFALVRSRARSVAKELGFSKCVNCGYDKHYEVCHIKPIKDFSLDTLVKDINSEENLVPLCPNCHWEFDKGLLKL